ncbi:unnamed protein product [Heterobilharzia americana]|nr:unnamed protein product [Heterobilharzia americana]
MKSVSGDEKLPFLNDEGSSYPSNKKTDPWYKKQVWNSDEKTKYLMGRTVSGWGLGMRPRNNFMTTLIAYAASDPQTYMPFVQDIRTFLYFYEEVNIQPQDGFATCDKIKSPDDVDLVCKFYPVDLGVCVKENNFGYDRSQPCVILKINKVYGWLPDIVNKSLSNNPLVRCRGQNPQDLENFGEVLYFPNITIDGITYGYFSHLYFPYLVQVAYRSPLVAVQFARPKRHVLLMVRCELFNVRSPGDPMDFEILVD